MVIQRECCPMLSSYKLLVLLAHQKLTLCLTYISCLCGSWDKDQNPQLDLTHNPVYLSGFNIPPLQPLCTQPHWSSSSFWRHPVPSCPRDTFVLFPLPWSNLPLLLCPHISAQTSLLQIGQLHGLATRAVAQGLHLEGLHAWFNVLLSQSWNSFEQRASHFHFALGHRNYVASSVLREASTDLPK